MKWRFFCTLLGLGAAQAASAQAPLALADSSRLAQLYTQRLGTSSGLYSGPEYVRYVRSSTLGHRFYQAEQPLPATITYAGSTYRNVPLRYDLVRGQLVLNAPVGALELRLLNDRVAGFTVGGHSFVRFGADSSAGAGLRPGFYDVLVAGPVPLLAAHHKSYQERSTADGIESDITASDDYFVAKGGQYYPVAKASAVGRLFPAHKAALRRYAKANKLSFGAGQREQSLGALVRYLGTLPAPPARP